MIIPIEYHLAGVKDFRMNPGDFVCLKIIMGTRLGKKFSEVIPLYSYQKEIYLGDEKIRDKFDRGYIWMMRSYDPEKGSKKLAFKYIESYEFISRKEDAES